MNRIRAINRKPCGYGKNGELRKLTFEEAVELVCLDKTALYEMNQEYLKDCRFWVKVIRRGETELFIAPPAIKNDKELIMLSIMNGTGASYMYASVPLRDDSKLLMFALRRLCAFNSSVITDNANLILSHSSVRLQKLFLFLMVYDPNKRVIKSIYENMAGVISGVLSVLSIKEAFSNNICKEKLADIRFRFTS